MKAGVIEVAHGFWRRPDVAELCARLGPAAGAYVLMAESYALESLPDGDFDRVSNETLASRCWFIPSKETAAGIRAAMGDLGFIVAGKLAGWEERIARAKEARQRMSQGGKNRAKQMWSKNEPAGDGKELLHVMSNSPAGDSAKTAGPINGEQTPFIQANNPVSGAGAGDGERLDSLPGAHSQPTPPVAASPAPVHPRLTKAEHAALLRGEEPPGPSMAFGPLPPPPKFGGDRAMIDGQITALAAMAREIKDTAIAAGRPWTLQEGIDLEAIKARVGELKQLAKGIVPPSPRRSPKPDRSKK